MNDDPFKVLDGDEQIALIQGDALSSLSWISDGCIDFVLGDVPYGLGSSEPTPEEIIRYLLGSSLEMGGDFMGSDWHIPTVGFWKEIGRVSKPGAHVFSYAGTRTLDLISMGIRMAGIHRRDTMQWLYAQGSPKGINDVSKAMDKQDGAVRPVIGMRTITGTAALSTEEKGGTYGTGVSSKGCTKQIPVTTPATEESAKWEGYATGLAPAWEPVLICRNPLEGTLVDNVRKHGVGALNIDACRVQRDWSKSQLAGTSGRSKKPDAAKIAAPPGIGVNVNPKGGWPTNWIASRGDGGDPSCPIAELDEQAGERKSGARAEGVRKGMGYHGASGDGGPAIKASEGSAERFFPVLPYEEPDPIIAPFIYCPKASRTEREVGCEEIAPVDRGKITGRKEGSAGADTQFAGSRRKGEIHNHGKCVKPINVNRFLCRLGGARPGSIVLVPFFGTGSEIIGCLLEGMRVIGIERDPSMLPIAQARITWWLEHPAGVTKQAREQHKLELEGQIKLLGR